MSSGGIGGGAGGGRGGASPTPTLSSEARGRLEVPFGIKFLMSGTLLGSVGHLSTSNSCRSELSTKRGEGKDAWHRPLRVRDYGPRPQGAQAAAENAGYRYPSGDPTEARTGLFFPVDPAPWSPVNPTCHAVTLSLLHPCGSAHEPEGWRLPTRSGEARGPGRWAGRRADRTQPRKCEAEGKLSSSLTPPRVESA